MGTGATSDPNSPNNPTNPGYRHNGRAGLMGRAITSAANNANSERIDEFRTQDTERLGRIASRRATWADNRANYDRSLTRARAGGTTPVFNPGQQVFK